MENELDNKKEKSKINRFTIRVLIIFILVTLLACVSFNTTFSIWDGRYPSGEFHLQIENEKGEPIEKAEINVFYGDTKNHAFNYPFDNYLSDQKIISDNQGVITILHMPMGLEFGGSCWRLFWLFPICSDGPSYDFQISADGYKTENFSVQTIFDLVYNTEEKGFLSVLVENGEKVKLPIYEKTIILEKEK